MADVTREEFDGLGKRLTNLRESFIGCRAAKEAELTNLGVTLTRVESNQTKLFEMQDCQNRQLNRIAGIGIAMSFILPFATAFIMFLINKVM